MPFEKSAHTPRSLAVLAFTSALLIACSTLIAEAPTPEPTLAVTPTSTPEPTATPAFVFGADPFSQGLIARRNGDYARAVAAFQAALGSNPAPDVMQAAQFRLGEVAWLANDHGRAIGAFTAYLQAYPTGAHEPETHYMLADAYRAVKDYANALAHLRAYRERTQTLAGDTDAAIADIMVLAGDSDNAIRQYDLALQDTTLTAAARIAILLRVAEVYAGRAAPALAAARYDAALAVATDARTRADLGFRAGQAYVTAGKLDLAIARWTDAFTKYPDQPGAYKALVELVNRNVAVDDFQRGLTDWHAGVYDPAIAAFKNHLQSDSPRAGEAHYYIARAYALKGAPSQAIASYDTLLKTLPKDKRVPDAYLGKAAALGTLGKVDEAVATYKKLVTALPEAAQADDALWQAALLLDRMNRYRDAARVYEELQAKYPARDHASEALFWAGMDYNRLKDYSTASARWQSLVKAYPKSAFYSRALFWLGKAAQVRGQPEFKNYWTQAAGLGSGYYSWRAADALNPPKPSANPYDPARFAMGTDADRAELEQWLAGWTKGNGNLGSLDAATQGDIRFRRSAELLRLDRTVEARREFAGLVSARQEDPRALYALALYFRDNNLFSLSLDCAERLARLAASAGAPEAPRLLGMLRYPTYYADLVVAESKANQLDPLLYFALIRQESNFNPWSVSSSDARGLGQIMPATGREIAQRLGVKEYALEQLFRPFVNIRFGVWYLAQDLKMFGEPIMALAAYNGGAGRAKRWQQADLDFAVEEIDASETNLYVRIVYSNWRQYQSLYQ